MAVGRGDAVYMYVSPIFEAEVKDEAYCMYLSPDTFIVERLPVPLPAVSPPTQEITTAICSRLERRGSYVYAASS